MYDLKLQGKKKTKRKKTCVSTNAIILIFSTSPKVFVAIFELALLKSVFFVLCCLGKNKINRNKA